MNVNNQTTLDNEINLREIILTLWKEKYLILIITLTFSVAGYIYGTLQPKVYQASITLRDAPELLFEKYRPFTSIQEEHHQQQQQKQISVSASNFNKEFKFNLLSADVLKDYVELNKNLKEFKLFLSKKKINVEDYFRGKLSIELDKLDTSKQKLFIVSDIYAFDQKFLNDYVHFVKKKTTENFNKILVGLIENKIQNYRENLEIALKIGLENPLFQNINNASSDCQGKLYCSGSKVLSQQLIFLKQNLNDNQQIELNYNPVLEKASPSILISTSELSFAITFFFLGLFISFVSIFLKKIF